MSDTSVIIGDLCQLVVIVKMLINHEELGSTIVNINVR